MINAKYPVYLHGFICDCFFFLPLNYAHHNYLTSFSNALFQFPLVALEDIAKL